MISYLHYDVFTDRLFEGNQLAVFPDARGLSPEQMQTIAREMNFSESTFLLPPDQGGTDVRMRIFTPGTELPMAGHPVIGTTFALAHLGRIAPGSERFVFGLGIGPTPVELAWRDRALDFAWMDQKRPEFRDPVPSVASILAGIGLTPDRVAAALPVREVSCGVPYICVPLASRRDVDAAEPDAARLLQFRSAFGEEHVGVFLFSIEPPGGDTTTYSRMFGAGLGVSEDPATGSASGPLASYLVHHRLVPVDRWDDMVSLQGVRMLRPSRIHMRITTAPDGEITRVQVGGRAIRVGEGSIEL